MSRTDSQDCAQLLREAYVELKALRARVGALESVQPEPIAIVGMACRFPGGVASPEDFWEILRDGVVAASEVPEGRWDVEFFFSPDSTAPGKAYTRHGSFVEGVDLFDAHFFGIAPREAERMDPQQRLLLEVSWEALERAGLATKRLSGSDVGVFVGIITHDYADRLALAGDPCADPYDLTGNVASLASGRLSYVLGLSGPSLSLDTACSSSLVAVHLACQSLRQGECSVALAGGVNLMLSPLPTISLCKMHALAPDGRCKSFEAAADGYGRGEGCGVVVLKRLSAALLDRDPVLAVIRNTAVNHDGRSSGLTVPCGPAQERLVARALAPIRVEPAWVDFLEAHGTATELGDPIEVLAMGAALGSGRPPGRPLLVGSVKANIGHLEAAAGVASLIKVVLALGRQQIPPQPGPGQLNPHLDWDDLPIQVVREPTPWPAGANGRLAGINSFGFSGTNAHAVVAEAPPPPPRVTSVDRPLHILSLSAKNEVALRELAARYVAHLAARPDLPFGDICFSAGTGRSHFGHRLAVVAATADEARASLTAWLDGRTSEDVASGHCNPSQPPRPGFFFTGLGSQDVGEAAELARVASGFRGDLEECDRLSREHLDVPLLDLLCLAPSAAAATLGAPRAQAALFAFEYALGRLWGRWGIEPAVVLGEGVGEHAAACASGDLRLEEALRRVADQALPMDSSPPGAMADVEALASRGHRVFVEIGPRARDLERARERLADPKLLWVPSLPGPAGGGSWRRMLRSLALLYVNGADVDWIGFDRDYDRRRVDLPTYPFQRRSYWSRPHPVPLPLRAVDRAGTAHRLLGHDLPTAVPSWEGRLDPRQSTYRGGGQWGGRPLAPVALYVEYALAAARALLGPGPCTVENLVLGETLLFTDDTPLASQVFLTPGVEGSSLLQVFTRPENGGGDGSAAGWTLRASASISARIASLNHDRAALFSLIQGEERRPDAVPDAEPLRDDAVRQLLAQLSGLDLESVPLVTDARRSADTVEACLFLPESLSAEIPDVDVVHPLLLRACLGMAWLVLPKSWREPPQGSAHLPVRVERITATHEAGTMVRCRLTRRVEAEGLVDLTILRNDNKPVLSIEGLQYGLTRLAAEAEPVGLLERGLYHLRWSEAGPQPDHAAAALPPGGWLIFADRGGVAERFAERLQGEGNACLLVFEGGSPAHEGAGATTVDPASPSDYVEVCRKMTEAGRLPWRGIVHFWSLDSPAGETLTEHELTAAQARGCESVFQVLKAHEVIASDAKRLLWLVTSGAQPAGDNRSPVAVAQAPIWGLGRVISLEHSELWGGLIDLGPEAAGVRAEQVYQEVSRPQGEDQIAYRGNRRLVARLDREPPPARRPVVADLSPDATFLITGGLGGIGLVLARWLADRGARHLVLTSRQGLPGRDGGHSVSPSGVSARRIEAITELERRGVSVRVECADVADREQMTALFSRLADGPPLRGVIHAAGITIPRLLKAMATDDLRAVMRPKVQGGWLLHELTRDVELDFFVLFSSVASVWGSGGLGNYAAANHFLDGLAHHRRVLGLPALCVNWGPWSEAGMMAPEELALLRHLGVKPLATREVLEALGRLLQADHGPEAIVAEVDWSLFRPVYEARRPRPLFTGLEARPAAVGASSGGESRVLDQIRSRDVEGRREFLRGYLRREIARCLHADPEELSDDEPMIDLGVDSLVVMEILSACERDLGLVLYPREFFTHPSVDSLACYLAQEIGRRCDDNREPRSDTPAAPTTDLLELAPAIVPQKRPDLARNPRAVFLLSAPRSGSTLLRVMMAGHSRLFCPPELHLLPFQTMTQRQEHLGATYLGEGLERALMEFSAGGLDEARAHHDQWLRRGADIQEVYATLQRLAAPRLLVDKSPSYGSRPEALERAEEIFEDARYVHLLRHPCAVIESFVRVRLHGLLGVDHSDPWDLAEQVWLETNRNVLEFGRRVGPERYHLVRYEDLVRRPRAVLQGLCAFLGVPFEEALLEPYSGPRMTDGVHATSAAIGDPNFLNHSGIESQLADAWRGTGLPRRLTLTTAELAGELGYDVPDEDRTAGAAGIRSPFPHGLPDLPHASPVDEGLAAFGIRAEIARRLGLGYVPQSAEGPFAGRYLFPLREAGSEPSGCVVSAGPEQGADGDWVWMPPGSTGNPQPLYGLDWAFDAIRDEGFVIVAEDCWAVAQAYQAGLRNVVTPAGRGRRLTVEQFHTLAGLTDLIIGCPVEDLPVDLGAEDDGQDFSCGALMRGTVTGPDLLSPLNYSVFLPSRAVVQRPPLLVFLQGAEQSRQLFVLFDQLMSKRSIASMAILVPDCDRNLGADTHDGRDRWESAVLDRLIPKVCAELGISSRGERTALAGISLGGLAALRMAFKRPEQFAAVAVHAPAVEPGLTFSEASSNTALRLIRPLKLLEKVFGTPVHASGHWSANHPPVLARDNAARIRASGLRIRVDCGAGDVISRDGTEFLAGVLRTHGIEHDFHLVPDGRHNRRYFAIAVLEGLQFVSNALSSRPVAGMARGQSSATGRGATDDRSRIPGGGEPRGACPPLSDPSPAGVPSLEFRSGPLS